MNDEYLLIQLRDCFTGGYTLPQFCRDNKIRKPLFVAEKKFLAFMWEIYVQFRYDKQLPAQFALLYAPTTEINFSVHAILAPLKVKNISEVKPADYDAVICLTARKIFKGRAIYLDMLIDYFKRKTYAEIPLLSFLQRFPRVKLFITNYPSINRYEGGTEFNSQLCGTGEFTDRLRADTSGNVKTTLDKFGYTNAQVLEISESPKVITNLDGSTVVEDTDDNSLRRVKNGRRVTADQPAHYRNKIYFVGQCVYYGIYAPFDKTIESYLQKLLNEKNLPYCVENMSQFCYGRTQDIFYNLNKLKPEPDDIIFVVVENQRATGNNIPFFDVEVAFNPPHDYREIFCTKDHINELGYKILAEKYFAFLTVNNFFRDKEFQYAVTPPQRTDTVSRRNSNRAA